MDFSQTLDAALVGALELPKDKLKPIQSNLLKSDPSKKVSQMPKPTPKITWRTKAPLSDSIIKEAELSPEAVKTPGAQVAPEAPPKEQSPEEVIDSTELDGENLDGLDVAGSEQAPAGMPSGRGYTVQQAKGQLDGIIKQWMDMAGNFPEGEKRHNFIEIGERLREISAVINRDYIEKQNAQL